MAEEEVKTEIAEEGKQEFEPTADETKALANGWTPKGEWSGDPEDWIPAKQFNRNGELFGRINTYKHKIQNLEQSVDALKKHNEKVYETGFKDAIDSLKAQRRAALREGDAEAVEQIEEKIEQVEQKRDEQIKDLKQTTAVAEQHPAFEPWVERNQWYASDAKLRGAADALAREIVTQHAGKIEFPELLKEVETQMKEEFPDKFGNGGAVKKTVQRTSGSERGDGTNGARRSSVRENDIESNLSDEERSIMNNLVKSGVITKDKYLKDMEKVINRKGRGR